MANLTRSSTSATRTSPDAAKCSTRSSHNTSTIEPTEVPLPAVVEEASSMLPETTPVTATAEAYQEDLIDYEDSDDDDVKSATDAAEKETKAVETEVEPAELTTDQQTALVVEQAKQGMAWSTSTMLTNTPEITTALHLTSIGATASTTVSVAGVTYEVTWKVIEIEGFDNTPVTNAVVPPTPTTYTARCKFGRNCTKGAACPFDHSAKPKFCTFVNTIVGCSNGTVCEYSHESEGVKCTRSKYRSNCLNGKACAYHHLDDGKMKFEKPVVMKKADVEEAEREKQRENVLSTNALTGPTLGKVAGQKRGLEDREDERPAQRPRGNGNERRGRGRGAARGAGRGRGRGRGNHGRGRR